jgi:hypothetical protein
MLSLPARRSNFLPLILALALGLPACGGGKSSPAGSGGGTTTSTTTDAGAGGGGGASPDAGCGALLECDDACVQAASCGFSVTSVAPATGAMNGGNFVTLHGHGFAAGMRVDLADGRAVVRVVDAQTALVQPPPGPQQAVDVTVTLSGATAVLPGGYQYVSGVLGTQWEKKQMATPRGAYPGLSLLQDGRMLIAGGTASAALTPLATADIYDPASGTASPAANTMSAGRIEPGAVTLMTGKALVLGNWANPSAVADLFDPSTNQFAQSSSKPITPRQATFAVLLVDGRVLVMSYDSPSAEIYDPATDTFSAVAGAPVITDSSDQPWPVRLRDGRVLVAKGNGRPCYFFDPDTDTFTATGPGPQMVFFPGSPREGSVTVSPDGRVFAVGGIVDPIYTPTPSIEVFDPKNAATGFQPLSASLSQAREAPGVALLSNGQILAIGGNSSPSPQARSCAMTFSVTPTVDLIDPVAGAVSTFLALPDPNWTLSAATLADGSIIAAGGMTCGGAEAYPYLYFLQGTLIQ